MGPLRELLAVDERRTLEFFVTGLQDVCDRGVDRQELLYNASVLAHYAQVSTAATDGVPMAATHISVFDQFVLDSSVHEDSEMMETALSAAATVRHATSSRRPLTRAGDVPAG